MQNKRRVLGDEENVVRHIPKNKLRWDGETDQLVGILPQAFELRPATDVREAEEYLSWWNLDVLGNYPGNIALCVAIARGKRRVGKLDAFVMTEVGRLKGFCLEHEISIRVSHEPSAKDRAYATVRDYANVEALCELLAANLYAGMVLNSQVSKLVKVDILSN